MSNKKFPETIQIGGLDYDLLFIHNLFDGDTKLNGHMESHIARLSVEDGLPDSVKRVVIWHEIIHEILDQAGHSDHDEAHVMALGYGIMAVLKHNDFLRQQSNVV